jgi:TonB-dependent receptor
VQVCVAAPAGTIRGRVIDVSTGESLPGANVTLLNTSIGAATDLDGNYRIPSVPPGHYTIRASFIGYQAKEKEIRVSVKTKVQVDFKLEYGEAIEGEEITVTAQASGQLAAINRQLTSREIKNVVSAEKMQELPDANAAESIGRLPGISLKRSSGEANKVVVRGLSPKYNNVTVEGVKLASTNDYDRSVDLSMVQGEMLGGVEVSKTLRPDMDADALGGTIDLKLNEADPGLHYSLRTEGGYANLNQTLNNYKLVGNVSNRFFNDKFGARVELSGERKELPSDRFGGDYSNPIYVKQPDSVESADGKRWNIRTEGTTLTDQLTVRHRYGSTVILDYESDWWTSKFSNLVARKDDQVINRLNNYIFVTGANQERFTMNVGDTNWLTDSRTHTWQNTFKFFGTVLNLNLSSTYVKATRDGESFDFLEIGEIGLDPNWLIYRDPETILDDYSTNVENSYMSTFNITEQELIDETYDIKLDYDIPIRINHSISGTFTIGGKIHHLKRESDGVTRYSDFAWGDGASRRTFLKKMFPWIKTDINPQRGINADNFLDPDYDPGEFLDGRYTLGWSADIGLLTDIHNQYYTGPNDTKYYERGLQSTQRDYTASEDLAAGYLMTELNIGKDLMLLPGVRFERMETKYRSYHVRTNQGKTGIEPNPDSVQTKRINEKWFPSVNFKYQLTDNAFVQGAVYKSTARPDFRSISPLVVYGYGYNIRSNNPYLKPSEAWNYDLGFSIFGNNIGLFSVYGYYKEIDDLIFHMNNYFPKKYDRIVGGPSDLRDRILGPEYYDERIVLKQNGVVSSLPINNPERAFVRGIEFSWQTHFWYLPGLMKGLVLDVNYSLIESETKYPYFKTVIMGYDSTTFIPTPIEGHEYRTRKGAMEDQPHSILNLIVGWDYKDFSSRLSFRYQTRTLRSLDTRLKIFDRYYDSFPLVDLMLRQKLNEHYSVYANLTNINGHIDDYYIGSHGGNPALPTSSEQYGFRTQFGVNIRY